MAPQQITPSEGETFTTLLLFNNVNVEFKWTVVPGADSYVLYIDDQTFTVNGTEQTVPLAIGSHKWRVNAVAGGASGPLSPWSNFALELVTLQVIP